MVNLPQDDSNSQSKKKPEVNKFEANVGYICYYCGWVRAPSISHHEYSLDHRLKASGLKKCGVIRVGSMVWSPDHFEHSVLRETFNNRPFDVNNTFLERSQH